MTIGNDLKNNDFLRIQGSLETKVQNGC